MSFLKIKVEEEDVKQISLPSYLEEKVDDVILNIDMVYRQKLDLPTIQQISDNLFQLEQKQCTNLVKIKCLGALEQICSNFDLDVLDNQLDRIIKIIIPCLEQGEIPILKKRATNIILTFRKFSQQTFSDKVKRDCIMNVVLESICNLNSYSIMTGLRCLKNIIRFHYSYMSVYMSSGLFNITKILMNDHNDVVVRHSILFWITLCKVELELGKNDQGIVGYYADYLVSVLLEILQRQIEEDELILTNAAERCLSKLTKLCEEITLKQVVPYVEDVFIGDDWRMKVVGMMAFRNILEGPLSETLEPLVYKVMNNIIGYLTDDSSVVRESVACTVGRVCDVFPEMILNTVYLPGLMEAMTDAVRSEVLVCDILGRLAKRAYDVARNYDVRNKPETYILSPYFAYIVEQLLVTADTPDHNQSKLQDTAYRVLMDFISYAPRDCNELIQKTTMTVIGKLESLHQVQDKIKLDKVLGLCGILRRVFRWSTQEDVINIAKKVVDVLIPILKGDQTFGYGSSYSGVREDAVQKTFQADVDLNNKDREDYLNSLRKTCIDTLVELMKGGRGTDMSVNAVQLSSIASQLDFIVHFVEHVGPLTSEDLLNSWCDLLVEIINTFGNEHLGILNTEEINLLIRASSSSNEVTKECALQVLEERKKL